jgi:hypothetical protein
MAVGFNETERRITSSKQKPKETQTADDFLLDNTLYEIKRVLDSDIEVDFKCHTI